MKSVTHSHNQSSSRDRADALIEWLRCYAAERINSRLIDERRCVPPYVVLDFGNHGVFGLQVPRSYGGLELGYGDALRVLQQLAAIDLTLATLVFLHNSNGARPIQNFATPELRDELLPFLAQGRELSAFALSEPEAGSNVAAIRAVAQPDGNGGWTLRGTKRWNASAWAGVISVFVRMQQPDGRLGGLTGFALRQGTPGLKIDSEHLTMGFRGIMQNGLTLADVRVTQSQMLGQAGQGLAVAGDALGVGRLYTAAVALGAMKRSMQLMVRYAARREVSTGTLLDNPVSRVKLTDATMMISAVQTLVDQLSARLDRGLPVADELFMAVKIVATESLNEILGHLMRLLGGRAYMEQNLAPQILRDGIVLGVGEGPNEVLALHLGRSTLNTNVVHDFLAADCGDPDTADRIKDIAQRISTECNTVQQDPASTRTWSCHQIGTLVCQGILVAALNNAVQANRKTEVLPALRWARHRFIEHCESAVRPSAAQRELLDGQEIAHAVQEYADSISDIQQCAAGVEESIDPLLQPEPAESPSA